MARGVLRAQRNEDRRKEAAAGCSPARFNLIDDAGRRSTPGRHVTTLSQFIRDNTEQILTEWETFARSLPFGDSMDIAGLRDHAKEMLGVIATDLSSV